MNYLLQSGTSIKFPHLLLSFCLCLSFLTGCGSDTYASSKPNENQGKLTVDLGPDVTVNVDESVYITAEIKNLGSSTVTYQWIQTSGNHIPLAADNNSYIEFTPLVNDVLEFEVTITEENGEEYIDSVIITVLPADQNTQYSALLSWTAPIENEDGSSLTNLAGYRIYYGQSASDLDALILVNDSLTTEYKINDLDSEHSYFFCVAAYNTTGLESQCSDAVDIIL